MFDEILIRITSNPILLAIAVIVFIFVVFAVLKKLFRLAGSLLVVAIIIVVIIYFTSEDPESTIDQVIDKGRETIDVVKEKAGEVGDELQQRIDEAEK